MLIFAHRFIHTICFTLPVTSHAVSIALLSFPYKKALDSQPSQLFTVYFSCKPDVIGKDLGRKR
jgi:hypothetical protein